MEFKTYAQSNNEIYHLNYNKKDEIYCHTITLGSLARFFISQITCSEAIISFKPNLQKILPMNESK